MKAFPSNRTMIVSIIAVLVYFNISFYLNIDKYFAQQQYQWDKLTKIDSVKSVKVVFATRNGLKIILNDTFSTPAKHTYALKNAGEIFFFRYEYLLTSGDTIDFKDVHWLKGLPNNIELDFSLIKLQLPLIQHGKMSFITIGDENFCRHYDEVFRKELAATKKVYFKGDQKGVLGFPIMAEANWSSQNIINITKNIPASDFPVVLFNWHSNLETIETYLKNLQVINENLLQKQPKKIFWIVPPAGDNIETNKKITKAILQLKSSKIEVLNPNARVESQRIIDKNGLYTKQTMTYLAKQILQQI